MWKLKVGEGGPWLKTGNNHLGRQHWEFDSEAGSPEEHAQIELVREKFKMNRFQNKQSADLLVRMQLVKENPAGEIPPAVKVKESEAITDRAVNTTVRRAISFFSSIQAHDGHWPSQLSGGMAFTPPMIIMSYITRTLNVTFGHEHRKELIRYIHNHQNEDGGWGFHTVSHSTMLGSVENYISLRLLGESPDDNVVANGRKWILDHGGAIGIPSWGKYWLTVLGVYEWSGCNPVPPELWLIPRLSFFHPGKMVALARMVYLPLSYLYGKKFVGAITELVVSLRQELYTEPYNKINWNKARNTVAKEDLYNYPHDMVRDLVWRFLHHVAEPILGRWPFSMLREKSLQKVIQHLHYEDQLTKYLCIASEQKMLTMVAHWAEDPNSEAFKYHLARMPDYFWVSEDGAKCQGNSSQIWDVALAVQAIISCNLNEDYALTLRKAHEFLKASQIRENPRGNFNAMHRHISKGAWTFTVADHAWPVSDCTAEGLKATLLLSQISADLVGEKMKSECFYDAVNFLLSYQSRNGGFPAWEPQRSFHWLEKLNPIEFLEDTLIEREYVECTSSAIQSLLLFKKLYPDHRTKEINNCVSKGLHYIETTQNLDGSWYGRWGICYTYGTWFAVEALVACGRSYDNSPILRKACQFLLSNQLSDGGWGESHLSCKNEVYTNIEGNSSNLVQTSWALLALIAAGQGEIDPKPIERGIKLLINAQMEDGDFPQQGVNGAFMKNGTLNYSAYRNIFTIWALGEYQRRILFA